jgi:hypothetical protein
LVFAKLRRLSGAETQALIAEALERTRAQEPAERRNASLPAAAPHFDPRSDDDPPPADKLTSFGAFTDYLAAYHAR